MSGGSGVAVPAGGGGGGSGPSAPVQRAPQRAAAQPAQDECAEPLVRARATELSQPDFPEAAREAGISGRVRIEITVDASGRVTSARVLQSLGHGCDEAALSVARAARFEPATRCGRAVASTFTLGIRFDP